MQAALKEYNRLEEEAEASFVVKTTYYTRLFPALLLFPGYARRLQWRNTNGERKRLRHPLVYKTTTTSDYTPALLLFMCRLQWRNMNSERIRLRRLFMYKTTTTPD